MTVILGNVLVTGASRGIGFEIVRQLAVSDKNHIFAGCRDPISAEGLQKLSEQHKNISILKLDVSKDSDIEQAVNSVSSSAGYLNVVINNAAVYEGHQSVLAQQTRELVNVHFNINVTSPILIAQQFRELLAKGADKKQPSVIVNISGRMGSIANATSQSYGYRASKAALNMATKCIANELATEGIYCVSIHPGWVQTDMGGPTADLQVSESVAGILKVTSELTAEQNGSFVSYKGQSWPY